MGLERIFKPFRNPIILGTILFGSLGLSALIVFSSAKINDRYNELGGDTNVISSPLQKGMYIHYSEDSQTVSNPSINYVNTNR